MIPIKGITIRPRGTLLGSYGLAILRLSMNELPFKSVPPYKSCPGSTPKVFKRNFSVDPLMVVTTLTESFQAAHTYTGIPWWLLIPISTFTLRTIWTLPLSILQRKRLQKQSEYKAVVSGTNPILKLNLGKKAQQAKIQSDKEMNDSRTTDDTKAINLQSPLANMKYEQIVLLAAKETRNRQKALFKKHNIQIWKNFILPTFQIPLWVAMSVTMRNLCGWLSWDSLANKPLDPSLYNEGLLWFSDLANFDHWHITPVVLGIVSLCNVEWTFKTLELLRLTQRNTLRPTLTDAVANISRMSVVFMMAISMNAPVGLTLYWISSQIYSLIQNIMLDLVYPISFSPGQRVSEPVMKRGGDLVVNRD